MSERYRHIVQKTEPGSIAEEMEIEPGDRLISINGKEIEDIFDYRFLQDDTELTVLIRKPSGEEWELDIEKDEDEDLGITFENGLMDDYRSCSNRCMFCFIDQMPPGMRDTLYFKDDDSRLSFLQGNYVTLTNMSDRDIDRLIAYRMEPINISIHTTNPELRVKMLSNRFAGDVFSKIRKLADAGIEMNAQIVLCKGVNDGAELDRTLSDLEAYLPAMKSVAIVPVGLTKYRDGLVRLDPFGQEDAEELIDQVTRWQGYYKRKYDVHFVQASDEWYLLAGRDLPPEEYYDGFLQLENGVGMLRLLGMEVDRRLAELGGGSEAPGHEEQSGGMDHKKNTAAMNLLTRRVSIATGVLPAHFLGEQLDKIRACCPGLEIMLYPIINHFFGERITVSGLVTGQDLTAQLKGQDLGDQLIIPCNMLRSGTEVFLDDMTVSDIEKELGISIRVTEPEGASLVNAVLGRKEGEVHRRRQKYE
ncbi:MAG: DUF512 domain-containing protein [Eubacterium sp.]|nr:DUF512 domain-containing protein [Eubacterium sp.]